MPQDPMLGKLIANCLIKELIGQGSIASVYLAYHNELKTQVAIKLLDARFLQGEKSQRDLKRFQREAHWATLLKHPNIVKVHHTGEEKGIHYIVMEYLKGHTLLEAIEKNPLSVRETCKIAEKVVLALKEAHARGLVHRDVKPGNIFLLDSGEIKLTDFGLARAVDGKTSVSQAGQIIGTIFYMSPEQAMGRIDIDHRADFYSLGITIFQALTGKLPYIGRTPLQVLQQHISAPLPDLKKYLSNVPKPLDELIKKSLSKKPRQRFTDADRMLDQIALCKQEMPCLRKSAISSCANKWIVGIAVLFILSTAGSWVIKQSFGAGKLPQKSHGQKPSVEKDASGKNKRMQTEPVACIVLTSEQANLKPLKATGETFESEHLGWFGEKMPKGLKRAEQVGDYLFPKDNSYMVYIAEGYFWRGNARGNLDERPFHKIYLCGYYLDKYEVTWKQYFRFCGITGHPVPPLPEFGANPGHPVVNVSWEDARDYASWAKKRLPTEAEWEKAARGGFKIPAWERKDLPVSLVANIFPRRSYPWGEDLPDKNKRFRCNYVAHDHWKRRGEDGYVNTSFTGAFKSGASPYHCMDMAGNVWEWCYDSYRADFYATSQSVNPVNSLISEQKKVLRGGSWFNFGETCRTTKRYKESRDVRLPWIGFRLVKPGISDPHFAEEQK